MDAFQDEGVIVAVVGHRDAVGLAQRCLSELTHRYNVGVGLAAGTHTGFRVLRALGTDTGPMGAVLSSQRSRAVLGHGTGAASRPEVAPFHDHVTVQQPLVVRWSGGQIAITLAGRLANGERLREELQADGAVFATSTDAETLLHLVARSEGTTFVNRLVDALWKVRGAFSAVIANHELVVAVRDPLGFRPLHMGMLEGGVAFATEDTALRALPCSEVRAIAPGEMVIVDKDRIQAVRPFKNLTPTACVEDLIGLALNEAIVYGRPAYIARRQLGIELARLQPCDSGTVVIAPPGSAVPAAIGFAATAARPFEYGIEQTARDEHRVVRAVVQDQHVVLVVTTVLTGETVRSLVALIRASGAPAVHVRVASPAVRHANPYGVASPTREELASHRRETLDTLAAWLDAESVGFLSVEAMRKAIGGSEEQDGWCDVAFTGDRPVPEEAPTSQLDMFVPGAEE